MKTVAAFLVIFLISVSCDYRYKRFYKQEYSLSPQESVQILSGGSQKRWKIIERRVDGFYTHFLGCKLYYRAVFDVNGMYKPGVEKKVDYCGEALFLQNRPYMSGVESEEYPYSFHESKPYLYLKTDTLIEPYLIFKLVPDTLIIGSYSYSEWDPINKKTNRMFVVETLIPEYIPNETRYEHM